MKTLLWTLLCLASFVQSSAFADTAPLQGDYNEHSWKLVWSDDFNGTGQPDPTKWTAEINGTGGGNNEAQFYTDHDENSYVENGHLVIKALKEDLGEKQYTSARLNSKESWLYGRFEIRAKLPTGRGTWPAAWMLPDQQIYGTQYWPDNGEIDIMEAVGFDQNVNHFTLETKDFSYMQNRNPVAWMLIPDADQEFHTYTMDWYPDHLDFWLDHVKYLTFEKQGDWRKWPFDQKFHFILNLAIGGSWGGSHGIDETIFPAKLEFDSVRVYQQTDQ